MNLNNLGSEREDIFIGNQIDNENLLKNLSYKEFVIICIEFTDKFVIGRSENSFLREDLYFSLNCNMKLNSIQIYNFINFFKKDIQRGSII